jgi:hypothetical protein
MRIRLTNNQIQNLQEALRDDIPSYMQDIIQKRYKGDYLDKDVPQHTDKIPNVKMEVKNDEVVDYASRQLVDSVTSKLVEQLRKSEIWTQFNSNPGGYSFVTGPLRAIMAASIPSMDKRLPYMSEDTSSVGTLVKFTWFYSKAFRLPDSRLNDDSILLGNPEDRKAWDYSIDTSKIKWSNNKTGISSFLTTIKRVFPKTFGYLDVNKIITDKHFVGLREPIINYQENVRKIGEYPLYLYITDRPDDKLRMSVSQFYDSCQNIYTGGDEGTQWNKKLLSNVFDKNSKVAYLIYNKPYKDTKGNEHPFTSIARCILRVNKEGGVMFDKVYPTSLEKTFYKIITDSTGIKNVGEDNDTYDYENVHGLPTPYMDKYKLRTSGGSSEEKMTALMTALNVPAQHVRQVDDESFNVTNRNDGKMKYIVEEFIVKTYDEALEKSRDIMRDDFIEIFGQMKTEELMHFRILYDKGWEFIEVLNLNDRYDEYHSGFYKQGKESSIPKFFSEVYGIDTVFEMEEELKRNKIDARQWFADNIDMDELIEKKYRSEQEFIRGVLNWSHDVVGFQNSFVYYRVDYVEDR